MPTINLTTALTRHDTTSEEDIAAVLIAKGTTMVVLCIVSISVGLVPIQLAKWFNWTSSHISPRSQKMVSILLGFGGGVLFSTTFLHLLPEVSEGVKKLVESGDLPDLNFSLAEIFMCSGFFIMYLVEEVVHTYLRKRETEKVVNNNITKSTNELVNPNGNSVCTGNNVGYGHGHSHLPPLEESNDVVVNSIRGLLIVLGLSVHELFEGLAIGLESSASYVWYMFAAVAAHKFVIAFCIGVELITSKTKLYLSVIYICTFAVVSPLGIGIGMLLVGGGSAAASGAMAVVLQGIATGTLLYVVFFEILHKHRNGLDQFLAILIGFVVMFGLQTVTEPSTD
ncbi:zinc transporter ZIP1 [Cephus cinctus]|uniref:Zinc transporter ZIP1 n=1 Tax=Cephus cinctus TaxID=211228 RepID=A0AAJ7BNB8_CEPCN|nr:zinc transporter ZIP1 [Cephus cinctus]